ncbi:MAG: hypothetical protein IPL52_04755 [Flavobacteriales bacterium]|nr:hypothetical protein [Flavobacteriales bacterium]
MMDTYLMIALVAGFSALLFASVPLFIGSRRIGSNILGSKDRLDGRPAQTARKGSSGEHSAGAAQAIELEEEHASALLEHLTKEATGAAL